MVGDDPGEGMPLNSSHWPRVASAPPPLLVAGWWCRVEFLMVAVISEVTIPRIDTPLRSRGESVSSPAGAVFHQTEGKHKNSITNTRRAFLKS